MSSGSGAVVCWDATAVPCEAAPYDWRWLQGTSCLILQVPVFLLTLLHVAHAPRDQLELSVFNDFKRQPGDVQI